jgi:D-aminopeptidase
MNKYLISVDIEGITGVINKQFAKKDGKYYQLGCSYMLNDVNAVVQGIVNADPDAPEFRTFLIQTRRNPLPV